MKRGADDVNAASVRRTRRRRQREDGGICPACQAGEGMCPSCVARGAYLLGLVERGMDLAQAAARHRLTLAQAGVLIDHARDRSGLRALRGVRPSTADARGWIEWALAHEPGLTRAAIARRMAPAMHPAEFDRTFGYAPRKHDGRRAQWVSVSMGSRLMLAIGRAPHELQGC